MPAFRYLVIPVVILMLAACAPSRYFKGHHLSTGIQAEGVISGKGEKRLRKAATACLDAFLHPSPAAFSEVFDSRLKKGYRADTIRSLVIFLRQKLIPGNGSSLEAWSSNPGRFPQETALSRNPFKTYDYVSVTYRLRGRLDARLTLFLSQEGNKTRLGGFSLTPWRIKDKYLFNYIWLPLKPHDQAGITGRPTEGQKTDPGKKSKKGTMKKNDR